MFFLQLLILRMPTSSNNAIHIHTASASCAEIVECLPSLYKSSLGEASVGHYGGTLVSWTSQSNRLISLNLLFH